ncbi:N-acetylphosphatidylethanolamine-hydrolyzing phospholipase D [Malassezia vespertilionis]|uniref:Metallo-beta-lactamase domain-containing protein n=1 Tax=Malassezia vespertilionis TaxID=2020962 RepID=A0A2N1JEX3_9BASI|nr:N-acetylphosphatidylethanolamine-hydrolyzing phospholipase D [Malassezia vespertilionis]PKI85099.1 hypothetical protein MVES_001355 [Malassezia vespertilionis]WFD06097.1 N-acetylphosphatidylethanolamine-hydrolyzing phospholipase D [Malassezia vespertilionis]
MLAQLGGRLPLKVFSYTICAWGGAWIVYYAFQECRRTFALRSRQRRFPLPRRTAENDAAWFGQANAQERKNIVGRFSPLKFLGRYLNVTPEWREQGLWEWMWWKVVHALIWNDGFGFDGGFSADTKTEEGRKRIETLLPVEPVDMAKLFGAPPEGSTYTWLGQSTCLIRMHGVTILTDPVFGTQPVKSFLSPVRMRPMPCTFLDLVRDGVLDIILVSHNHFDHLDLSIIPHVPRTTKWVVSRGMSTLLRKCGVPMENITELAWWEEAQLECTVAHDDTSVTRVVHITGLPASHWSARTLLDTNKSLWSSYAVRVNDQSAALPRASLFFCGDSGYSPDLFRSIGRMYGPFHLATIPIGSYEPRWHLSLQHMDPLGSVSVAEDIGAAQSFGMHWGTWCMSDERWDAPPADLALALAQKKLPCSYVKTVPLGQIQHVPLGA